MNATIQINKRGTLTLPKALRRTIEIYTDKRIAEFDAADKELGRCLKRRRK